MLLGEDFHRVGNRLGFYSSEEELEEKEEQLVSQEESKDVRGGGGGRGLIAERVLNTSFDDGDDEVKQKYSFSLLQNRLKRDPEAYKQIFLDIYKNFLAELSVVKIQPKIPPSQAKSLAEMTMFLAHTSPCYGSFKVKDSDFLIKNVPDMSKFLEDENNYAVKFFCEIIKFMKDNSAYLNANLKQSFLNAFLLLKSKHILPCALVYPVLFDFLAKSDDRLSRNTISSFLTKDFAKICTLDKSMQLKSFLQNMLSENFKSQNANLCKKSLFIMINLYKRKIWLDKKTINLISELCFVKDKKSALMAVYFLLGNTSAVHEAAESSDEDREVNETVNKIFSKKTYAKKRKIEKIKQSLKKKIKKKESKETGSEMNFAALDLLNDPLSFSERLLNRVKRKSDDFQARIAMLDLISRLIARNKLILLNFYAVMLMYINTQNRFATKLLAVLAQSFHELIPPQELQPIIKVIMQNFACESQQANVIVVGLNAIREMAGRAPLCLTEDMLLDLSSFYKYKNKDVSIGAKSLINIYRDIYPSLLKRAFRGKFSSIAVSQNTANCPKYGEVKISQNIDGAHLLRKYKGERFNKQSNSSNAKVKFENELNESSEELDEEEESSCEDEEEGEDRKEEITNNEDMNRRMLETKKQKKLGNNIEKKDENKLEAEGEEKEEIIKEGVGEEKKEKIIKEGVGEEKKEKIIKEGAGEEKEEKIIKEGAGEEKEEKIIKEGAGEDIKYKKTEAVAEVLSFNSEDQSNITKENQSNNENSLEYDEFVILDNEDFKKIKKLKMKIEASKIFGQRYVELSDDNEEKEETEDSESEDNTKQDIDDGTVIDVSNLQGISKRRKKKIDRIEKMKKKELFGAKSCKVNKKIKKRTSMPNKAKARNKPLMMAKHSQRLIKKKVNLDVRQKVKNLRQHIKNLKKKTGEKKRFRRR